MARMQAQLNRSVLAQATAVMVLLIVSLEAGMWWEGEVITLVNRMAPRGRRRDDFAGLLSSFELCNDVCLRQAKPTGNVEDKLQYSGFCHVQGRTAALFKRGSPYLTEA